MPQSPQRLRTVTLAPASRSRCVTGCPSVPVPPVTRIDVVMTFPFTGRTNRGWNTDHTGTILGNGQPARPASLPVTGLTMAMLRFTSGR